MMNEVIIKKIESLIRCIKRIEAKRPDESTALKSDYDLQDIISVNLERAVQISVDISAIIISERDIKPSNTMAGTFKALSDNSILPEELSIKLQKSVGFRNISVHEYNDIDWEFVFDIIHNHLSNFKFFIKEINNLY
ncbi:MAG: DUF86 domain-containing protein [Spirochaetaceae bacterium]